MTDRRKHWWRRALYLLAALVAGAIAAIVLLNMTNGGSGNRAMIEHSFPTADPQFRRTMNATFSTGIEAGNRIDTLLNGDDIFPAMLDAIRQARDTINFETYIYWDGMIAAEFAPTLAARASEGLEVRVLIDWVGSQPMDPELITMMTDAGVRFERLRPLRWYNLDRINNRTHRKLLIVDGGIGFTGGVGVADKWLGDARGPHLRRRPDARPPDDAGGVGEPSRSLARARLSPELVAISTLSGRLTQAGPRPPRR